MDAKNEVVTRIEFQDHEDRLKVLETNYSKLTTEVSEIKSAQYQTQSILLKESQDQKDMLNKLIDQTFGLKKITARERWKFLGQVTVAIFGAGGFLAVILEIVQIYTK